MEKVQALLGHELRFLSEVLMWSTDRPSMGPEQLIA
jgi:hypothetical protein